MYDEPPPRPFHTFKFPHITVEVETTPQVCYNIFDDVVYDRCYIGILWCVIYIKSNETLHHLMIYQISNMARYSLTLLLRWKQRPRFVICHGIFDDMTYHRKSYVIVSNIWDMFLHINVEVETTPYLCHGIFDDMKYHKYHI